MTDEPPHPHDFRLASGSCSPSPAPIVTSAAMFVGLNRFRQAFASLQDDDHAR